MQPLQAAHGGAVTSRPRSKAVTIAMLVVAAVLVLGVVRAGAAYLSLRGASGSGQDPGRRRCRRGRAPRPGGLAEDEPVPDGIEVPDVGTGQELTQKLDGMLDD